MLNKSLLPTAYLAPIGYYAILLNKKDCIIEYHENFIKQSIRNRCEIYGSNGKLRLTVPVKRQGAGKTLITDIKISYKEKWQKVHWNAIISSYNSSPFFNYYKEDLRSIFEKKEVYLIELNNKLHEIILNFLKVDINLKSTNTYNKKGDFIDLRNHKFINKNITRYNQVFMEKYGFISNLSILDLVFNLGPNCVDFIKNIDDNILI